MSTMKKEFGDYYLGLDIGTDSVGWAVTDLEYKIQKLNGKALWGIRLFESGKTAEDRRLHRAARRRQQRRVQRIQLLQELFAEEISKVDQGFFLRLKESKFYKEDKVFHQKNTLFSDKEFTDIEYHKKFPTIYHLRKTLMDGGKEFDIRLVYLALHHIIKKRGHFLFQGQNMESISSFQNVFEELVSYLQDELQVDLYCQSIYDVELILKNRSSGVNEKKKQLNKLFQVSKKQEKAVLALMVGATAKLSELFEDSSLDEGEITKVCFSSGKYEEEYGQLEDILDEKLYLIEKCKAIYDWTILADILQGQAYLSFAKTAVYEKHQKDLKILKRVIKNYYPEKYKEVFSNPTVKNNYCAYIGMTKKNGKKLIIDKCCSQEDFHKFLVKILKGLGSESEEVKYLLSELENKTLLPKQISKDNGVIPYQLHFEELKVILQNASEYLPFLNEVDDTGFSVIEKIKKLFLFRIPYYVGPLNNAHEKIGKKANCWIVKRAAEKIRPWNFEQVVDIEASAERFIQRMTNKCTYLIGADVLPKNSLLYSEYMVLNECNNLRVNGEKLPVGIKQKLVNDLFRTYKRVTMKQIRAFFISEGIIGKNDEITGVDDEIKSSMTSYIDFKKILGERVNDRLMVETIIRWIVLFGDDRKLLKNRLEKIYGEELSNAEIKQLLGLKYTGWGRLSQEFLEDINHVDGETGEIINIITALRETNENLMQLLSNQYQYFQKIKEYNNSKTEQVSEITYNLVDELYVSPSVKRSIWQTLTIVQEIEKVMGHPPKKVFVEMARGAEEKKRTQSRKSLLKELYKSCKKEERNWIDEIDSKTESDFRRDRLYLYYTQMGRCMYSGELIDLGKIYDANVYDVDHIYPQSKVKDDSIENRVLVKRTINADKSDVYPLPKGIQEKNKVFWSMLYEKKLIGKKKFDRLTRNTPFTEQELADFISRQLVETRQSTKAVAAVLKRVFEKTEIVYVKAGNVSDFRHKFALIKVREINDYHHAKDAYLNIVVGNVYNTKFTKNPLNFIQKKDGVKYSLKRMYDFDVVRGGIIGWQVGEKGTIQTVKKTMKKNNILFTRYAIEQKGELFDQMIVKKGKGQLPIKSSDKRLCDTNKYGGYNKVSGAYFMCVEHTVKKKRVRSMEFVPVYLAKKLDDNEEFKLKYCKENLQLVEPKILIPKIKINTLFEIDGFRMHLSGRTGERLIFKGANQLCISKDCELYLKKVLKYLNRVKEARVELPITSYDKITEEENLEVYNIFLDKLKNTLYAVRLSLQYNNLVDKKEEFIKLSLVEQCKVLGEILHLFQCNSVAANLTPIGLAKSAGILVMSNKISKDQAIKIIHQSPTGIFTQEIDLAKL